ncbi:hypothetical protein [Bacillus sp. S/N-304-OC-R1]|uniref:hypothetical protein n=1 Tax=Bacillus sp. S/N-304-OC-R1 TaxID=2758034 RepID=UPI001C8D6F18|nr:hypothetical protein [Bacillus sp. S/N-304-OC-R1]MBY0120482.1 hypothetical protein [Bacillus sp. S/N-304-OC-R1]
MSIKDLFNQNRNHENITQKILELEKSFLKINTLELHIKRLLKLEEKLFSIQKIKDELMVTAKNLDTGNLNKDKIEYFIQSKVQEVVSTALIQNDDFNDKIKLLEKSVESIKRKIAHQDKVHEIVIGRVEMIQEKMNTLTLSTDGIAQFNSDNNDNYNETEHTLFQKLELIEQKLNQFEELNKKEKGLSENPVVIKEIHIDKFYLDKYEQNNNIAQVGIKELSGALNIGATFGKDTIPKEMNEQLKEYFDEVIAMKADKNTAEKGTFSNEQTEDGESNEFAEDYSDIVIEEEFSEIQIEEEND